MATQGATVLQLPLVGDGVEVEELEVALVDELCELANDEGVPVGDTGTGVLVPDKRAEEIVPIDPSPPDSAFLITAAKFPFSVYRWNITLLGC